MAVPLLSSMEEAPWQDEAKCWHHHQLRVGLPVPSCQSIQSIELFAGLTAPVKLTMSTRAALTSSAAIVSSLSGSALRQHPCSACTVSTGQAVCFSNRYVHDQLHSGPLFLSKSMFLPTRTWTARDGSKPSVRQPSLPKLPCQPRPSQALHFLSWQHLPKQYSHHQRHGVPPPSQAPPPPHCGHHQ